MTGAERNKKWKLKRFGETPRRKAMPNAERRQKRRDTRKVKTTIDRILRAANELASLSNAPLPLRLTIGREIQISTYTDDSILKLYMSLTDTDGLNPHNWYLTPHHGIN